MINYTFFQKNPASHYVYIDMEFDTNGANQLQLQLPSWRPGRYELGNFAKNIKKVEICDEHNSPINFIKSSKDLWKIENLNCKKIKVSYSYYAAELNAGACFADAQQIYMNPVHCCFYILGREEEANQINLQIPDSYKIACSLRMEGKTLFAKNYDELVESPFIASSQIQSNSYEIDGVRFYLHFNGICKPDFERVKKDFTLFTNYQKQFWGSFPFDEYHFIFQIAPYKLYHGVEHFKNTVIALGPGYDLFSESLYESLLGVSCHELFHAWNIKLIRPIEMLPYDYTKENYAPTGYVYEGFTTYYGDKNLFSSGVFDEAQYFKTFEERLDKHFVNFGRFNLSVADSSWETWLDGYMPGAPYRKTNIYDEGCLIAFMLDVLIMQATDNKHSLKDVCRILYKEYGLVNKGYSQENVIEICEEISSINLREFFNAYVLNPNDFENGLLPCFEYLGLTFEKSTSLNLNESKYGFKTIDSGQFSKIVLVAPYSPAWKAGLFVNDEIIAVNKLMVRNNLPGLLSYSTDNKEIELTVSNGDVLKTIILAVDDKPREWFFKSKLIKKKEASIRQIDNFNAWIAN